MSPLDGTASMTSADLAVNPGIDNLTNAQWKMAGGLVKILAPFNEATEDLCGETYPTLSMVIPILHYLDKQTCNIITSAKSGSGIVFARNLVKSLKSRFPLLNKQENTYLMSMCLDPRYKMAVLSPEEKVIVHIKVTEMCKKLQPNIDRLQQLDENRTASSTTQTCQLAKSSVWSLLDDIPKKLSVEEDFF